MQEPTPSSAVGVGEFSASFPPQFIVLGVKLLPLSLGRYRLMKYAEVAFVSEDESSATIEDLFTGIVICGMPCEEFKRLLSAGRIEKTLRKWGRLLRKQIRREKDFNIIEKIGIFNRYIQAGQQLPWIPLQVQSDNQNPTNTHWSNNVEVVLRGHLGWTKQEIDEEPLTKALADYFKHMENEGCVRLMPHGLYKQMVDEGEWNMKALEKMMEVSRA